MTAPDLIRAKITGKTSSSGTWLYAWKEVSASLSTGADEDPVPQRTGTTSINTAVEVNNHEVDVNTVVWLRRRGYVSGTLRWEFQYEPSGGAITSDQTSGGGPGVNFFTNNTWIDVGGTALTLPAAGTYLVYGTLTSVGMLSTQASGDTPAILMQLLSSVSAGSMFAVTPMVVAPQVTGKNVSGTGSATAVWSTGGTGVTFKMQLNMQAAISPSAWAYCQASNWVYGWVKIG